VCNGYEREFLYVYGAVSPTQGQLDWMIAGEMNTVRMSEFLAQVSAAHRRDFIIMVVDGASSHVAKDLVVPKHMRLLRLPPYAPELNPQEHAFSLCRSSPLRQPKRRQSFRKSLFFVAMRERSMARQTRTISSAESEREPGPFLT
jgi:transposase